MAAAPRSSDPHDELAKFGIQTKDSVTPEEKFLDYLCMIAVSEELHREDYFHDTSMIPTHLDLKHLVEYRSRDHRARQQAFNHAAAVAARSGKGADGFDEILNELYGDKRFLIFKYTEFASLKNLAQKAQDLKEELLEAARPIEEAASWSLSTDDEYDEFRVRVTKVMHVAAQLGHNHVFAILTKIPRYEVLLNDEDVDSEDPVLGIHGFYGAGVSQATREFEKSAVKKAFDLAFTLDDGNNLAAHYAIQVTGMNGPIQPIGDIVHQVSYKAFIATDGSDGESHFGICRLMNATALVDFGFESQETLRMKVHEFMCQRNSEGETPFDLAVKSEGNNISLLRMMKRRGCDPYMGQRINVWQSAREGDDSLYVALLDPNWLPGHYSDRSQMRRRGFTRYQYDDRLDEANRVFLGCAVAGRHDVELHLEHCQTYTPGYSRRINPDGTYPDEAPASFVGAALYLDQGMNEYDRPYIDSIRLIDEEDQAKALSLWALRGSRLPPEQKAVWLRGLHNDKLFFSGITIYAALLERFKEEVSADIWELLNPSASADDSVHRAMQDVFRGAEIGSADRGEHLRVQIRDKVGIPAFMRGRRGYVVKDVTEDEDKIQKFLVKLDAPVNSAAGPGKKLIKYARIYEDSLIKLSSPMNTSMENTGIEGRLFPYKRHIEKGTEPSSAFQLRRSFVHLIL